MIESSQEATPEGTQRQTESDVASDVDPPKGSKEDEEKVCWGNGENNSGSLVDNQKPPSRVVIPRDDFDVKNVEKSSGKAVETLR